MSKALYRKYRSKSLDEIIGQSHVTDILKRSIASGRIAHAYLLTGPRGVGKTSIARILAHDINKLPYEEESTHLDIIEIDAASNNGVEDVRDLREKVQIAPVSANKKVYIIDEVHMLSKQAFNALLKTLEEPPAHIVFILATTDVDKLPATIISRTQQFTFRAISTKDAVAHLKIIAEKENILIDDDALEIIAVRGDGSFRDSISLLDQVSSMVESTDTITREIIESSLGLAPSTFIKALLNAYRSKDLGQIVTLLDESERNGIQTSVITSQLIAHVRAHLVEYPEYIQLLDNLLEVGRSSQPDIKLLTTLAARSQPKQKSVALSVPAPAISAPIKELEQQATRTKPQERKSTAPVIPSPQKSSPAKQTPPPPQQITDTHAQTSGSEYDFDWSKLIEHTRQNYVAIYSVLAKCGYSHEGSQLILYTGTPFWKRKLDDAKHRINLVDALVKIGAGDLIIETIGTPPPPKDETAAAVAAIMGGGEEVVVTE